jgi:2-dehydrotetronate isomerase
MPRFAANISMMYTEHAFLDRFAAAARDGFRAVEMLFPYDVPIAELARQLREHRLEACLLNTPPGNWEAGDRGLAAQPGREAEFEAAAARALEYAQGLGCTRLHVMAGLVGTGADRGRMRANFVANLQRLAPRAAELGVTLLLEPINTRDIPAYFLNTQADAHAIVAAVAAPNVKVQMDLYHCQIVEGDVAMKIRQYIGNIGHIQIAGTPGRHEPDSGELNYPYLFSVLDELGFAGWIGAEYRPQAGTSAGLGWIERYRPL